MISLKQSLNDYERAQCLASGMTDTLVATLDCLRQYVVDTDPPLVEQFRLWADDLISSVQLCVREPDERSFGKVRTGVRAGLRDYHDRAGRYIDELRARLATTTAALHEMLGALQSGDSDAEAQLKNEITRLECLAKSRSVEEMRTGVRQSVVSLAACSAQLRQEKDLVIAQLRDEIHTLQNSLEQARRAATIDVITAVYNRQEFERMVAQAITTDCTISVVRLKLQNFGNLATWYQRNTMDQLVNAFCKRARGVLPEDAMLGRWRENVFCALLHTAETPAVAAALVRKCTGNYVCMDRTYARTIYLQVAASSFTWPPGADAELVIQTLGHSKV